MEAIEILGEGYGFNVRQMNFYQFRVSSEEFNNIFFDWYHTTGSLVMNKDGYNSSLGKVKSAEALANVIHKNLYERKNN